MNTHAFSAAFLPVLACDGLAFFPPCPPTNADISGTAATMPPKPAPDVTQPLGLAREAACSRVLKLQQQARCKEASSVTDEAKAITNALLAHYAKGVK